MKQIVYSIIFVLLIVSCKTTDIERKTYSVYVTNSKKVGLLAPYEIENNIDCEQLLNGSFGEKNFTVLCYLKADENGIFISLYNEFGAGMGNLSYDGKTVLFESNYFPKHLKAEYIISDLQFAYFNLSSVSELLENASLMMKEKVENGTKIREIYDNERLIEKIEMIDSNVKIENYLRGYKYELQGEL